MDSTAAPDGCSSLTSALAPLFLAAQVCLAQRWRLQPTTSPSACPPTGCVSADPITFHLDPSVPEKWRSCFKHGVEAWDVAFQARKGAGRDRNRPEETGRDRKGPDFGNRRRLDVRPDEREMRLSFERLIRCFSTAGRRLGLRHHPRAAAHGPGLARGLRRGGRALQQHHLGGRAQHRLLRRARRGGPADWGGAGVGHRVRGVLGEVPHGRVCGDGGEGRGAGGARTRARTGTRTGTRGGG